MCTQNLKQRNNFGYEKRGMQQNGNKCLMVQENITGHYVWAKCGRIWEDSKEIRNWQMKEKGHSYCKNLGWKEDKKWRHTIFMSWQDREKVL